MYEHQRIQTLFLLKEGFTVKFRMLIHVSATLLLLIAPMAEGRLFAGLEGGAPATQSSDLTGFPAVTWTAGYNFDVSGAAATPTDTLYLCNGAFNTDLYKATLNTVPVFVTAISEDMTSLAYGRDTLWGFSNYASTKGIYSIDTETGAATLKIDTYTGTGFRFFALGYNQTDDMLYGYTEYGTAGLYSINIDTGEMLKIADPIPASNSQGRGMAIGDNVVYITATRGDDGVPYYAYNLAQGTGGTWEEFTNPYPAYHSTGGAAWLTETQGVEHTADNPLQFCISSNPVHGQAVFSFQLPAAANTSIEVYDTSGRIQATVFSSTLQSGSGEVLWNPNLPSGVYIAVLRSCGLTASARLILI